MPYSPLISPSRGGTPSTGSPSRHGSKEDLVQHAQTFFSTDEDDVVEEYWSSNGSKEDPDEVMEGTGLVRARSLSSFHRRSVFLVKQTDFQGLGENQELLKAIAFWLTSAGDRYVSERNFVEDLADGVALCTVLSKIHGSGVNAFHKVAPRGGVKAQENWALFRRGCDRLCLPVAFSVSELEEQGNPNVVSTLVFLAHVCYSQGICTEAVTETLQQKLDDLNDALDDSALDPMSVDATAQTIEESLLEMQSSMSASAMALLQAQQNEEELQNPWYQRIAQYLDTIRDLKEALKRSRQEQVNNLVARTVSFKNNLPTTLRSGIETISENILHHADSLPDVIRSRLPLDAVKRLT